jgi:hypothetical protein
LEASRLSFQLQPFPRNSSLTANLIHGVIQPKDSSAKAFVKSVAA